MSVKRNRAYWYDGEEFPVILGQGSIHDLQDNEGSTPRLYAQALRPALG